MKRIESVAIALVLVVLAGCGGQSGTAQQDDPDLFGEYGGGEQGGADTTGASDDEFREGSAFGDGAPMGGPGAAADNRIIYFEFDQSDVDSDYADVLRAHGSYLAANAGARLRLEGHADERGSREYNLGLGERRAQAVKQVLLLQGASAGQLSTVSYGEERPASIGSDESTWGLNRRVELVYQR